MDMIDEVVSNYKRQKICGVAAVHQIKCILDIVASSDSEDTVPSGSRIILPQHQIVPRDQIAIVARWLGIPPSGSHTLRTSPSKRECPAERTHASASTCTARREPAAVVQGAISSRARTSIVLDSEFQNHRPGQMLATAHCRTAPPAAGPARCACRLPHTRSRR